MEAIGRRRWAIPEGYIPSGSSYSDRDLDSHETACILNTGGRDAHVALTIFFRRPGAGRNLFRDPPGAADLSPSLPLSLWTAAHSPPARLCFGVPKRRSHH